VAKRLAILPIAIRLDEASRGVPWNGCGVGSELFEKLPSIR
jgi:hypothetical protein